MSETQAVRYFTAVCLVVLTLVFVMYIVQHMAFMSYVHKFGFDALSLQQSYFKHSTSDPMASYNGFIGAGFFVLCFILFVFKFRKHIIGVLPLILAVWLIITSLDEYYVTLNFHIVVIIGAIFEVIALGIGTFILIGKGNSPTKIKKT